MHHYPFHVGDYLLKTVHLPPMADLVYRRLLDLYYMEEGPIPNKPKWVATRIRLGDQEPMVLDVLRSFFKLDGAGNAAVWRNSRADKVILAYQRKVATARANGALHTVGTKKEPKSVADRTITKNQEPRTKRNTPPTPHGGWEAFERWYLVYPLHVKRQDAVKAWNKLEPDDALQAVLIESARAQVAAGHFTNASGQVVPPYPATWLNGRRWEEEPERLYAPAVGGAAPANKQEALEARNRQVAADWAAEGGNSAAG